MSLRSGTPFLCPSNSCLKARASSGPDQGSRTWRIKDQERGPGQAFQGLPAARPDPRKIPQPRSLWENEIGARFRLHFATKNACCSRRHAPADAITPEHFTVEWELPLLPRELIDCAAVIALFSKHLTGAPTRLLPPRLVGEGGTGGCDR